MAFNDIYVDGTRVMMGGPQPNNCSLLLSSDSLIYQYPNPLGQGYEQTILWTYSGVNEFLGLATTSGATTPTYAINTTIDANMSDDYPSTFYSVVVQSPVVTVTYGNISVGTLTQLGQKMRIPSTTLTQDGFAHKDFDNRKAIYELSDMTTKREFIKALNATIENRSSLRQAYDSISNISKRFNDSMGIDMEGQFKLLKYVEALKDDEAKLKSVRRIITETLTPRSPFNPFGELFNHNFFN